MEIGPAGDWPDGCDRQVDGQGVITHGVRREAGKKKGKVQRFGQKALCGRTAPARSLHGAAGPRLLSRPALASPPGFFPLSLLVGTPLIPQSANKPGRAG